MKVSPDREDGLGTLNASAYATCRAIPIPYMKNRGNARKNGHICGLSSS